MARASAGHTGKSPGWLLLIRSLLLPSPPCDQYLIPLAPNPTVASGQGEASMAMWLYQLSQSKWTPNDYRVDIWEGERWRWEVGEVSSASALRRKTIPPTRRCGGW